MHFVYILQCYDNSYYTGYTTNIQRRLEEHNNGSGSKITRSKLPVVLVYQESYNTKSEALKRESQIKSWSRAKKEALIKGGLNKLHVLSSFAKGMERDVERRLNEPKSAVVNARRVKRR